MRLAPLFLRLLTTRSWLGRLTALAALSIACWMAWQDQQAPSPGDGQALRGRVTKVADGDTLEVMLANGSTLNVRLAYVDAPESAQPDGTVAGLMLAKQVLGRQVLLNLQGQDKYGRSVAEVRLGEVDIGLAQVQAGHAWHYEQYARGKQAALAYGRYQAAQLMARQQGSGLWGRAGAQAPWDYRQQQRAR
ncbi:MAG: thermonuclease family protein [Chitinimonas sp.]|nr:thermonuclease family protein [Chitinimonas sp.]